MRAIGITDFEAGVVLLDLPRPEPEADELLVRVEASSINPYDVKTALGRFRGSIEYDFPIVLGRDFAGVVEAVGPDVVGLAPGDPVFGYLSRPHAHLGAWAEYLTVHVDGFVVPRPDSLAVNDAAALPVAGLTALALVDAVDPRPGDLVLIVGAAGGVGTVAVQLAAARGATVIATATADDEQRLLGLGAAETIDYTAGDLGAVVRARHPGGVHALIDVVDDAPGFAVMTELVEDGGRAATSLQAAGETARITALNVSGSDSGPAGLGELAELAAAGSVKVTIEAIRPLDEVPAAIEDFLNGRRGKTVISVSA